MSLSNVSERREMEILTGVLTVKQSGVVKIKPYEKHWCTLFHGVKTLCPRIDIYDRDPRAGYANVTCKKTIYLESASWKLIDTLEPAFSFEVKNGKHYNVFCNTVGEKQEWILSLCCVCEGLFSSKHVVGVANDGTVSRSPISEDAASVVIQNNVYGGVPEVQNFFVLADQTDGCLKLGWKGVFRLGIGKGCVKLSELSSGAIVVLWQVTELRTYGGSSQTAFVQAGSRSSTGEGRFTFRTPQSTKIIEFIERETEAIQKGEIETAYPNGNNLKVFPTSGNPSKPNVSSYVNVKTNSPSTSDPMAAGHDKSFIKQLDSKLDSINSGGLDQKEQLKHTISNSSSDSRNQKLDKQEQRRLKEEQKRMEKQRKEDEKQKEKERKQKEKEDKKIQKELERKQKEMERQQKKGNKNSGRKDSHAESVNSNSKLDNVYSEPADTSVQGALHLETPVEDEYAEAGDFCSHLQSKPQSEEKAQIYLDPWENKPLTPPINTAQLGGNYEEDENIYAAPVKKNITKPRVPAQDSPTSEADSSYSNGPPPAIIPPIWSQEGSSENMDNVYAHTNEKSQAVAIDYGNVYGVGSASAEFVPNAKKSENIYDM